MFNPNPTIAVIGLGYVGLSLAGELGKIYKTIGFDINIQRVKELSSGEDLTQELSKEELASCSQLSFTSNLEDIRCADVYIVTVPTPIDVHHRPDLTPLKSATQSIGKVISKNNIVIYESTVFPGCTEEVLLAAGSKWNFLGFRPGLVGGHCIGVDPYYLTHKAQEIGYHPEVILSGRRINDSMGIFVAESVVKLMLRKKIHVVGAKVLVMGLTFKENCPDIRNSRVIDIIRELESYNSIVDVHDPWVLESDAKREFGVTLVQQPQNDSYDAIVLCVGHQSFKEMHSSNIRALGKDKSVLFDVKHILPIADSDGRL